MDIVNGLSIRHGRVLMARRSPLRPRYPGSWSFPGGQVEACETFGAALLRELREAARADAKEKDSFGLKEQVGFALRGSKDDTTRPPRAHTARGRGRYPS